MNSQLCADYKSHGMPFVHSSSEERVPRLEAEFLERECNVSRQQYVIHFCADQRSQTLNFRSDVCVHDTTAMK